jgi:hypothetical protein
VFLADVLGWCGRFMEAEPHMHHRLLLEYRWSSTVTTLHATVTPERVAKLFGFASIPAEPGALEELGRRKGHLLVHTEIARVNAFFVRDDLARAFDRSRRWRAGHELLARVREPPRRMRPDAGTTASRAARPPSAPCAGRSASPTRTRRA